MILPNEFHIPVLLTAVIEGLQVSPGKKYIDATVGSGGYAFEMLKLGARVLGIDLDIEALNFIEEFRIKDTEFQIGRDLILEQDNFRNIRKIAQKYGFGASDGIIFDLGMSTYQLEKSGRGFSFAKNEMLDMRFAKAGNIRAVDILNKYSEGRLYEIFTKYSEELNSRAIAHAVVRARTLNGKIATSNELAFIIDKVLRQQVINDKRKYKELKNKTLSRIFQSLRIEVNSELDNLKEGLKGAVDVLNTGGRLAVISYHSLEDRITKFTLREFKNRGIIKMITHSPLVADFNEKRDNPKSRSAKLRIAEKL